MNLDDFIWLARKKQCEIAKVVGVVPHGISHIKLKKHSPSLLMAVKLMEMSRGRITARDLLSDKNLEELDEWYKTLEAEYGSVDSAFPKLPGNL